MIGQQSDYQNKLFINPNDTKGENASGPRRQR